MIRNDPTEGEGGLKKEVDGVCEKRLNYSHAVVWFVCSNFTSIYAVVIEPLEYRILNPCFTYLSLLDRFSPINMEMACALAKIRSFCFLFRFVVFSFVVGGVFF